MLQRCDSLWGAATVIDSDPVADMVADAVYLPLRPDIFLDRDPGWGIYGPDGVLQDACAYYRLPAKALIGQSPRLDLPAGLEAAPPGTYVYGGPVIMHYGHFLTAALPRLWQAVRRGLPAGARIVCHSHQTPAEWFEHDYVRTILGRLGLTPGHFVQFDRPTRIRRLHAPRPALEEQNFAHRVFRDLCLHIGGTLQPEGAGDRVVYLSKTRMQHGTARLLNEDSIEAVMQAHGIEVLHPEALAFADQVALLASSRLVIGTAGSAFHTAIFCRTPPRMIGLTYGPALNANYALIDKLAGHRTEYVYAPELAEVPSDAATFCYLSPDPAALAEALIAAIQ